MLFVAKWICYTSCHMFTFTNYCYSSFQYATDILFYFRGTLHYSRLVCYCCFWDYEKCPDLRGVVISECPDLRGSLISECPDLRGFTVYLN